MSPQTPDAPKLSYGELEKHPIDAKKLVQTPEGWEKIQTVFDHELYEPLGASTRAEQLDAGFGPDNWGIVLAVDENGETVSDRMYDIVAKPEEAVSEAEE